MVTNLKKSLNSALLKIKPNREDFDIFKTKTIDPNADTSQQEAKIDRLVYELYGLSESEIAIVEGK